MLKTLKTGPIYLGLLVLASLALGSPAGGDTGRNSMDIAVIDRALASAPPGAKTVKFGDCGMRISDLKVFRARLVAEDSPTPGPTPNSDTPNGTSYQWPGGKVYYDFDPSQVSSGTITAAKMQMFRDGVGEWAGAANLQFIEFTGTPPANYVTVQEDAGAEGGFSTSVGMAGGQQFVQFGPTSWNRGTICHEVGHALGYYHEQQRDDRDTYVIIDFNNIASSEQANFTKLPNGSTSHGAYDFYSVMHYSRNALAINPAEDTITMQPDYTQYANIIGEVYDRTLSTLDRAGMASIYGNPSVLPSALVTNTKDSGPGSLRAALYYAYDQSTLSPPKPTTITFNIPKTDPNFSSSTGIFKIAPSYLLTSPGDGTTIDGTTEETFTGGDTNTKGPAIELNGATQAQYETIGAGYEPSLVLRQANCTLKALIINGYDVQGLIIMSDVATGNLVSGCYIGVDSTGTKAVPNGYSGIEIYNGAHGNTIGGTTTAARNIISGNTDQGIYLHDPGTNGNLIEGNYIGLVALGAKGLPNGFAGVEIGLGAQANTVGGTATAARNVISGNALQGIAIDGSGTNYNVVLGDHIGLNSAGTAAVGNGLNTAETTSYFPGIDIFGGAQNNTIGGTTSGSPNVISGNVGPGIDISDAGTNGNRVEGNLIGTNGAGTAAIANGKANPSANYLYGGVEIFSGAQSNIVGGTTPPARNIISGNAAQGIYLASLGTSYNLIEGNYIGTNKAGTAAIANGFSGVGIFSSASSNTVGGAVTGAMNLISGNTGQGLVMGGPDTNQTVGPAQNIVEGNEIGVNLAGTAALANGSAGIFLYAGSQSNIIGGAFPAARNIISGNGDQDVALSDAGTSANVVLGNYIGLDKTGTNEIANNNSGVGFFNGAANNILGGAAGGAGNFISGHAQYGLFIENSGTTGNSVQGNTIGLNTAGAVVGNGYEGVAIFTAAASNSIGGTTPGAGNVIAGNTDQGIGIYNYDSPADVIDNSISENSIFDNSAGVYLYNGANNSQAAPALTSAVAGTTANPGGTNVSGKLTSTKSTTYRIEFFSSPSGNEGQTFLGSASVTTNSSGVGTFTTSLAAGAPSTYVMTATATDPNGNTSQLSAPVTVAPGVSGPRAQTITFPAIANQPYSKQPVTLNATATSDLAVSYAVASGPATISGDLLTITGVGTISVQAAQAGNSNFAAATPETQSFAVSKATQTITFPGAPTQTAGGTLKLTATSTSGLSVSYKVASGPGKVANGVLTFTGAGSVVMYANQAGNTNYTAAPQASQTFIAGGS